MNSPGPLVRLTLAGFAGLALVALLLLTLGAEETDDWFSWTILPPLSAAALGAFYGTGFVVFVTGARATPAVAARQIVPPALVIATALLVVTLIHLDKFDMDSLFGVFWLCAYIVAPPLLILGLVREREALKGPLPGRVLPGLLRVALGVEGMLMVGVGALLLFAPESAADCWPWQLTPLVARAFGCFLLGIGVSALIISRDNVLAAPGIAAAYVLLGAMQLLAVAVHSSDLGDDDLATAAYLGFFGLVLLTGLYGLWTASSASSRS